MMSKQKYILKNSGEGFFHVFEITVSLSKVDRNSPKTKKMGDFNKRSGAGHQTWEIKSPNTSPVLVPSLGQQCPAEGAHKF